MSVAMELLVIRVSSRSLYVCLIQVENIYYNPVSSRFAAKSQLIFMTSSSVATGLDIFTEDSFSNERTQRRSKGRSLSSLKYNFQDGGDLQETHILLLFRPLWVLTSRLL